MLGSLRVRLPLVFLAGIVLAGVITTLISVRLFQDYSRAQTLTKLKREAHGIAVLYARAVDQSYGNVDRTTGLSNDRKAPTFALTVTNWGCDGQSAFSLPQADFGIRPDSPLSFS